MKNKEIRTKLLGLPFYNWYGSIRPIPEEIYQEIINYCSNPDWSLFLSEMSFPSHEISKSNDELLKERESQLLEFKSSMVHLTQKTNTHQEAESKKASMQKEIFIAIVAFSNTKGGTVIVGVDGNGKILGIEHDYEELKEKNWDGWQLKFRDLADKYFDDKLLIDRLILKRDEREEGKSIVRIDVPESSEPIYLKKSANETEFYIRTFTSSQKLDAKYIPEYINSKKWKK